MSFRIRGKVGLGETRSCQHKGGLEDQDQGPVKVTHVPTINAMRILSWVPKETLSTHSPRFSLWFKDKDPSVNPVLSILLLWNLYPHPSFIIEGVFVRYQRPGSLLTIPLPSLGVSALSLALALGRRGRVERPCCPCFLLFRGS